jgi:hypothetical protein
MTQVGKLHNLPALIMPLSCGCLQHKWRWACARHMVDPGKCDCEAEWFLHRWECWHIHPPIILDRASDTSLDVCTFSGDVILTFEGTLRTREIKNIIEARTEREHIGCTAYGTVLLADGEVITDEWRPWDRDKLDRAGYAMGCLQVRLPLVMTPLAKGEPSPAKGYGKDGKGKKFGAYPCSNCGERPWTDADNWTPRCRCGWW